MKKITIDLYNSLEDKFESLISKEKCDDIQGTGVSIQILYPFDVLNSISKIKEEYEKRFISLINKLIELNKITKIYFIGLVELAQTSPLIRLMFLCYHNKYDTIYNPDCKIEGLLEGMCPTFLNLEEFDKYLFDNYNIEIIIKQ